MTERQLQAAIEALCRQLGLMYYHTHRSQHSPPGWPDIVIVAPGRGALVWELKREGQQPTPAQQIWLAALESVGWSTAVIRPSDLLDGTVVTALQRLAHAPLRGQTRPLLERIEAIRAAQANAEMRRNARTTRPRGRAA